jgi:hypothetical protein
LQDEKYFKKCDTTSGAGGLAILASTINSGNLTAQENPSSKFLTDVGLVYDKAPTTAVILRVQIKNTLSTR